MGINIISALKCALLSVILTVIFVFIISLLSYFTGMSETSLTLAVYVTTVISVFVGSFLAARISDNKPLIASLILTVIYYALLFLATVIINGSITPNSHFITMTAGIFASGILGAVIGK